MAFGTGAYTPGRLRLAEALAFLTSRGQSVGDAKIGITRMIQDHLCPRSLGGMFRLPNWRHSPRFHDRSWVTSPALDWENSTIKAPDPSRMGRVPFYVPTLIEISAADLDREFPRDAPVAPDATASPQGTADPAATSNKGGRPTDRDRVTKEAGELLEAKKLQGKEYRSKAALARDLRKWLDTLDDAVRTDGEVMSIETIEGHISDIWQKYSISPL